MEKLMEMGFDADAARRALREHGGNLEEALMFLLTPSTVEGEPQPVVQGQEGNEGLLNALLNHISRPCVVQR
jgi:hypothetical protein